jgi:hypothetical protein
VSLYKDRLGGGVPGFDRGRLWEEVKPRRYSFVLLAYCGLLGDERDVRTGNAQIAKFAGRQTVQFSNRVAITAPVAVRADKVHFNHHFGCCSVDHS